MRGLRWSSWFGEFVSLKSPEGFFSAFSVCFLQFIWVEWLEFLEGTDFPGLLEVVNPSPTQIIFILTNYLEWTDIYELCFENHCFFMIIERWPHELREHGRYLLWNRWRKKSLLLHANNKRLVCLTSISGLYFNVYQVHQKMCRCLQVNTWNYMYSLSQLFIWSERQQAKLDF